jgi:hypothetical protein
VCDAVLVSVQWLNYIPVRVASSDRVLNIYVHSAHLRTCSSDLDSFCCVYAAVEGLPFNTSIAMPVLLSVFCTPTASALGYPCFRLPHGEASQWAARFNASVSTLLRERAPLALARKTPPSKRRRIIRKGNGVPLPTTADDTALAASDGGSVPDKDTSDYSDSSDSEPDSASTPQAAQALANMRGMMADCIAVVTAAGKALDDERVRALAALEYLGLGFASVFTSPGFMAYVRRQAARSSRIRLFAKDHESLLELLSEEHEGALLGVCALLLKRLRLRALFTGLYGAENGRPLPKSFSCAKLLNWGLAMAVVLRRYYERLAEHEANSAETILRHEVASAVAAVGSKNSANANANAKPGKFLCMYTYLCTHLNIYI